MEGREGVWLTAMIVAGVIATVHGLRTLYHQARWREHAVETTGTVVGHLDDDDRPVEVDPQAPGLTGHTPVIAFADEQGNPRRVPLAHWVGTTVLEPGAEVTIRYPRDNPTDIELPAMHAWRKPFAFVVLGTLFLVAGLATLVRHWPGAG